MMRRRDFLRFTALVTLAPRLALPPLIVLPAAATVRPIDRIRLKAGDTINVYWRIDQWEVRATMQPNAEIVVDGVSLRGVRGRPVIGLYDAAGQLFAELPARSPAS